MPISLPRLQKLLNSKFYFSLIIIIWTISLVLPHFQPDRGISFLLLSALVFLVLMHSINVLESSRVSYAKRHLSLLGVSFFLEILLILLTIFGIEKPYLLLSRLGSYSMFQNGNLMLFGDLRHLTSTVNCPTDIQIGANICDPWGRGFNQNPDISIFFKLLNLSSPMLLGMMTTIFFFLVLLFLIHNFKPPQRTIYLLCFTPPVFLAIDRGNEIITITLILIVVLLERNNIHPNTSIALLGVASIFKFWPITILIIKTLASTGFSLWKKVTILVASGLYVAFHLTDIRNIAQETQQGDLNGGSFGVKLLEFQSFFGVSILCCIAIGLFFLRVKLKSEENALIKQITLSPMLKALLITYCFIFILGTHFNYRLVILLPVCFLLLDSSKFLILRNFLFATLLTSRLNIASATTSIIAAYFSYILCKSLIQYIRVDSRFQFIRKRFQAQ